MPPNLRHLQSFQEIARRGGVSAAARSVHVSQPALTKAVTGLEAWFGGRLLERRHQGAVLTAGGEICLARVDRAMTRLRDALGEIGRSAGADRVDFARLVRARQLDAFSAVVESGNFSGAARAKRISQSSIHRSARELERILGIPLFERTSFGVVPTRDAAKLARRIRLAFLELTQAREEIQALSGSGAGRTVVGALPLARSHLVPAGLLEFSQANPRHRVEIVDGTYENLIAGLRTGEIDIVIGALREPPPTSEVVQEHLFDDPLAVVARSGHPLAGTRRPTLAALRKCQWIAPRRGSPLREHFDALLGSKANGSAATSLECNSLGAARAFLLESDRLMLLSAHQIHYERLAGMLITLPHPAGKVVRRIGMTSRRGWRPTSTQEELLSILRRVARAGHSPTS
jgi:LysR family transcriptional regulator, regulator for genes of the gallate degradation pathway